MPLPRHTELLDNARSLRKNMTRQERHLWYDFLRYAEPRFRRQVIIGKYIVDFLCHEAKLVIELDGSQHYEQQEILNDNARTAYLHDQGLRVLRLSNYEVDRNFSGVCQGIALAVEQCGITLQVDFEKDQSR